MFATREMKEQNSGLALSIKDQTLPNGSGGIRQSGFTHFRHRYLGNSYLQSIAEGQQVPEQVAAQGGVATIQRK